MEYALQELHNQHQHQQVRFTEISFIYQLHISYMNVYVKYNPGLAYIKILELLYMSFFSKVHIASR